MEDRLQRVEDKIDKLTEAVTEFATVSEKLKSVNHRLGNLEVVSTAVAHLKEDVNSKHNTTNIRLTAIETKLEAKENSLASRMGDKAVFVGIGILVMFIAKQLGLV